MKKTSQLDLIILVLIPSAFFLTSMLFIPKSTPAIIRYHLYAVSFIVGLAISGPRYMRQISNSKENLLWNYCGLVLISVEIFFAMDAWYLMDAGIISSTSIFPGIFLLMVVPTAVFTMLSYEILESRLIKRSKRFRFKRVSGRLLFLLLFVAVLAALFRVGTVFIPDERFLWVAFVLTGAIFIYLIFHFRDFFEDMFNGNW